MPRSETLIPSLSDVVIESIQATMGPFRNTLIVNSQDGRQALITLISDLWIDTVYYEVDKDNFQITSVESGPGNCPMKDYLLSLIGHDLSLALDVMPTVVDVYHQNNQLWFRDLSGDLFNSTGQINQEPEGLLLLDPQLYKYKLNFQDGMILTGFNSMGQVTNYRIVGMPSGPLLSWDYISYPNTLRPNRQFITPPKNFLVRDRLNTMVNKRLSWLDYSDFNRQNRIIFIWRVPTPYLVINNGVLNLNNYQVQEFPVDNLVEIVIPSEPFDERVIVLEKYMSSIRARLYRSKGEIIFPETNWVTISDFPHRLAANVFPVGCQAGKLTQLIQTKLRNNESLLDLKFSMDGIGWTNVLERVIQHYYDIEPPEVNYLNGYSYLETSFANRLFNEDQIARLEIPIMLQPFAGPPDSGRSLVLLTTVDGNQYFIRSQLPWLQ